MIEFTEGNLLESKAEAMVNTVNTVGVMGKGIALMFKEAFPENFKAYSAACKRKEVHVGHMFVTEHNELMTPHWIINFPTKEHWRQPSQIEWIESGLKDLVRVIRENNIRSIAIPPLGSGNGGLDWQEVRPRIVDALKPLDNVAIVVFEPTREYQNVAKRAGVEKLTPARALVAELVRRYGVLGLECALLEIQKLAYFLERHIIKLGLPDALDLRFEADRYGPYATRLRYLLDGLDGSYLHCEKRLGDADPLDVIWFDEAKRDKVSAYLTVAEVKPYRQAMEATDALIDGFQSPLGMELLATVDWLLQNEGAKPTVEGVKSALAQWPAGDNAGQRKLRLFDDRLINLALERLTTSPLYQAA